MIEAVCTIPEFSNVLTCNGIHPSVFLPQWMVILWLVVAVILFTLWIYSACSYSNKEKELKQFVADKKLEEDYIEWKLRREIKP